MIEPHWALAAGCVPDVEPWEIPRIAKAAGFTSCGMWVDPKTSWQEGALGRVSRALNETGVKLVDVEACWLEGGSQPSAEQALLVEVGLALQAPNVLVVSRHDDYEASIEQFRGLCEKAGDRLRLNLEFGEFTSVKSLAAARAFIAEVDHPAAGILVDLMHLNRAGEPLPSLDDPLLSYVQACDFMQSSASMTGLDYITAAVDGRCCLGEGEARTGDIETVRRADIDVSLEIRSKALRDQFPDPVERARQIFERCRREVQA